MRIALLSAYDAASHRRWRHGLTDQFPEYQWQAFTLPPRHFAWRIRGNALSWALGEAPLAGGGFDAVVATSMVDLATLRGLLPSLAPVPALVYFHENQFAYPRDGAADWAEPKMVNLYSALCARRLLFNSCHNRDTFLEGAAQFLSRMPDGVPAPVVERLAGRSQVLPIPLEDHCFHAAGRREGPFTLVWNHRWEYDKGPECFFSALQRLKAMGLDFRVHVLGQRFRRWPAVFDRARAALNGHLGQWGPMEDPAAYRRLLRSSHAVVSTALHEFQGLAVLEAVAAGCLPVVPDRLAYPEYFEQAYRYTADNPGGDAQALAEHLGRLITAHGEGRLPPAPDVRALSWSRLRADYGAALAALGGGP